MATARKQSARAEPKDPRLPTDSRGNKRVYTDVPAHIAQEFAILAIRRKVSKRALMAQLIMDAVTGR
jgi:hypothetical protein